MKTRLAQLLENRNMNFAALAEAASVNKSTITRWSQERVPAERVLEVERITGIPRHELRPDLYEGAG